MNNQVASERLSLALGLFSLALAISLGAFAAHGLKDILDPYSKDIFFKANFYHFVIALTILILANAKISYLKITVAILLIASFIFSGSLYLLAITGVKWLGAITPIGGTLMIGTILFQSWNLFRSR